MEDIKVGDMVKVVRKAKGGEMVNCYWDLYMDNMIGGLYKVDEVDFTFSVCNINGYRFPIGCCEKVNSNEVIMGQYSYKGITDFDKIIEDNKGELAFIIKGKENFAVAIDKRIKSRFDCPGREFFGIKEKDNKFWFTRGGNNTKFKFILFNNEEFKNIKTEIFNLIQEFKSRTVKKVYTFR